MRELFPEVLFAMKPADPARSDLAPALAPGGSGTVSYEEFHPVLPLAGVVRTVWIQSTGTNPYLQRHLPTGGVELHFPLGGRPQVLGPLAGPLLEVIPPLTTVVGVRFHPGAAPRFSAGLHELVDLRLDLAEVWAGPLDRLVEAMTGAPTPGRALQLLQADLVCRLRGSTGGDPLVGAAARALMPWRPVTVDEVAAELALSPSQLRRRCLPAVGVGPKVLQRILRFQGFLALAQAGVAATGRPGADGVAGLAIDAGYADQAHLSRECLRLTGLTPSALLGGTVDRCSCGHEHGPSYSSFLAARHPAPRLP